MWRWWRTGGGCAVDPAWSNMKCWLVDRKWSCEWATADATGSLLMMIMMVLLMMIMNHDDADEDGKDHEKCQILVACGCKEEYWAFGGCTLVSTSQLSNIVQRAHLIPPDHNPNFPRPAPPGVLSLRSLPPAVATLHPHWTTHFYIWRSKSHHYHWGQVSSWSELSSPLRTSSNSPSPLLGQLGKHCAPQRLAPPVC